ncbi:CCA tRNA nucleotidyltransferase [Asticcacaulis sp. BYS171W]|uniref:CCA tRNA nucleotidyltransferase n=1 Tax=Asticcacaulis aquaticus TaxID=2984212 RepID=A0ABT5HUR1_9CAUL|nr:CCA tRNA nucleotidyltransferase [Asticcacaulis aquaticus]MDC7683817.1 CCA tRNA nucleotidyltransferase [Asticcacaulis aquaticus]
MLRPAVRQVFAALEARGGAGCVRFVGGCVRNVVMGRAPTDLDLSTQLTPDQTEAALSAAHIRHVPTGKAFGTISAIIDGEPFEITSLREDVETDGRRAVVSFTTDWAKDAQRRDFYLNALYADIRGAVFDPTGEGFDDARDGRVRFIGDAETRIREDYLRILRFFRFTASHGQSMDAESFAACARLKSGIDTLSGERISQELFKLLAVDDPTVVIAAMIDSGVMAHVLPSISAQATPLRAMCRLTSDIERRLLALLHPDGLQPEALECLSSRLRLSNRVAGRLRDAARRLPQADINTGETSWRRMAYRDGKAVLCDALILHSALSGLAQAEWQAIETLITALDLPVFPLKSAQLIAAGLTPGPELGQAIKRIEADWIAHDFSQNVIDAAIDEIRERTKI